MVIIGKVRGYRSRAINALIDALARQRPVAGHGLLAAEGPGGTVISLARRSSRSTATYLPWEPVLFKGNEKWQIKFLHAGYVRGPVTYMPYTDDEVAGPYELNPADGEGRYYVGVKIDTELGSIVSDEDDGLLLSQTIEDVATFRLNPLPESKYFNKILCSLDYTSESDSWTIHYAGYAILPELGAYL